MRVLAIHRYYWPDTPPYASILRSIVGRWRDEGHEVEVLTSQPSYKVELDNEPRPTRDTVDGAPVRRIPMRPDRSGRFRRVCNMAAFPLAVAAHVLVGRRRDVVMCSTAPPVLLGAAASFAARIRGAQFVYHCMDLHPEIGVLSGDFSHPVVRRTLARVELGTCRRAARIVVLSEDMRAAVLARDPGLAPRVRVIQNFALPDYDEASEGSPVPTRQDRLRVAFAGNVGRFQGLETLTRAVLSPGLADVELVIMGEGAAKQELAQLVARATPTTADRVTLVSHGSVSASRALMRDSDVGVVSLSRHVIQYAYPSKTGTYLSEGLPLLVAVEQDSSLAAMTVAEGVGLPLPSNVEDARRTLSDLSADRSALAAMSDSARKLWRREFSEEALLPEWSRLLEELGEQEAA